MIDCIDAANAGLFARPLDEMYRRRYEIFVQRRGWTKLGHHNGRERDQFDTDAAVYLLSIGDDGHVHGGLRLISTTEPHLLSEVFPHAVAGPVPRGPDILEMTRYFTVPDRSRPRGQQGVAGELLCAMIEYGLGRGCTWITTMLDTFYVRRMQHNGWTQEFIGAPIRYDEGVAVAARIAVTEANLQASRAAHGIEGPILRRLEDISRAA